MQQRACTPARSALPTSNISSCTCEELSELPAITWSDPPAWAIIISQDTAHLHPCRRPSTYILTQQQMNGSIGTCLPLPTDSNHIGCALGRGNVADGGVCFLQFIYAGKKSTLSVGNVKAIGDMPEGTVICNVEEVSLWCILFSKFIQNMQHSFTSGSSLAARATELLNAEVLISWLLSRRGLKCDTSTGRPRPDL